MAMTVASSAHNDRIASWSDSCSAPIAADRALEELRSEPRFRALLAEMRLVD